MPIESTTERIQNRGICSKCGKVVPAHHEERDNKVYLVKECTDCGRMDALVSSDARRYNEKRDLLSYAGEARKTCSLLCASCDRHRPPTLVFIDVTNRCNMNCPICLANIPAMGFRFDPPMAYFEKIFEHLSRMNPKPRIQLFGGEPTVREDLIEMIKLARKKYGLLARVVTNGLRLADEAYCKELTSTGTQIMFSFDGRSPEIYRRTRKHPEAYERKIKALENLAKYRKSKITIMCCVSPNVNGEYLADLVDFCHEQRHCVKALDLIPLTAHWGPEEVEAQSATIEDVEKLMAQAMPGIEFFPAGTMAALETLRSTYDIGRVTFGGAHPNCESVSLLISDGKKYHPVTKYMKSSMMQGVRELLALDRAMGEKLKSSLLARLFGRKGRQLSYGLALYGFGRRNVNMREVFGGAALPRILRIGWGLLVGRKMKDLLRAHTRCHGILRLIVLPFEETECVEAARLVECPAAFAYEHPETKDVRLMPVCTWAINKNAILRVTADNYGVDHGTGEDGLRALNGTT